jgi:Cu+-exporting ATPase
VIGGTLNKNGMLRMIAERVGQDTVLARIIKMVREAQGSKAPIANLADRISLYFVPTVMVIATLSGLAWYFIGAAPFPFALRIFIAVLVIACPCAMGLATPTSIMVGTGRGAQLGVLIKSGEALEMAQGINALVFDKTGTLTYGTPELTDILLLQNPLQEEDTVLELVAGAESVSEHPLAEAIVRKARERKLPLMEPDTFEAIPGKGIKATVGDTDLVLGNREFVREHAENSEADIDTRAAEFAAAGKTSLFLAVNGKMTALLAIADQMKPETPKTISRLRNMGIQIFMLTGDNETTARAIAARAGIDEVMAEVLPDFKADKVAELQKKGKKVGMVGDGINDAPALAKADVGIAMGTGIDVAVESGDIVLMKGELGGVLTALALSRATMRNIKQNLFWAFAYNVVGIPVAAGLLYIFGGPTLNPMIAGGAMALSSVSVVTNALRLRFYTPEGMSEKN